MHERKEELKKNLENRLREVAAVVRGMVAAASSSDDVEFAVLRLKHEELKRIRLALSKVDDGTYGICECGEEISPKRLMALPFAVRCTDCENEFEAETSARKQALRRQYTLEVPLRA